MSKRKEVTRDLTRRIELTYLQSVQLLEGDRPPEDFFEIGTDFSPISRLKFRGNKLIGRRREQKYDEILRTKFPYSPDPQQNRSQDTGWILTDQYKEVDWSKVCYRIGIREIGLNSFEFAPVSTAVSLPISSPKPIWKIVLRAKEEIPKEFNPSRGWIWYFVSVDDGANWIRINPLDKPTRFSDTGTVVPRVITINSEIVSADPEEHNVVSTEDIKRVRLKYTLFADKTTDDPTGVSPVLKSVQLLMYPKGGLSGADTEQVI
jgi:hypothetical protein